MLLCSLLRSQKFPDQVRSAKHHREKQKYGPRLHCAISGIAKAGSSASWHYDTCCAVIPQVLHLSVHPHSQDPLQPSVQVAQGPHEREGRQHFGEVDAQAGKVVGHVEHGAEAVVDGREGGIQHHADGGESVHDALNGLERSSAALFRLLHEAAWRHVLWEEAAISQTAVAVRAVRTAASIGRAAEGAVGGGVRAVGWAVGLLNWAGGYWRSHACHGGRT